MILRPHSENYFKHLMQDVFSSVERRMVGTNVKKILCAYDLNCKCVVVDKAWIDSFVSLWWSPAGCQVLVSHTFMMSS